MIEDFNINLCMDAYVNITDMYVHMSPMARILGHFHSCVVTALQDTVP